MPDLNITKLVQLTEWNPETFSTEITVEIHKSKPGFAAQALLPHVEHLMEDYQLPIKKILFEEYDLDYTTVQRWTKQRTGVTFICMIANAFIEIFHENQDTGEIFVEDSQGNFYGDDINEIIQTSGIPKDAQFFYVLGDK